jgi:putative phage-type endonuclease
MLSSNIHPQVLYLKTLPHYQQKSPEWYAVRENMITASDIGSITGDNPYTSRNQLMIRKTNREEFKGNQATMWGNKYEEIINIAYAKETNTNVIEFGLIQHPTISFLGASPDGIREDGVMVEIKCPTQRKIVHGEVPRYYWVQVQIQLEVCNLEMCDFVQCKINEISEYNFNDKIYEFERKKKNNLSVGMLLEYIDKDNQIKYIYPPTIYNSMNEWNEWKKQYQYLQEVHWEIETYSNFRIYRDRQWFTNKLPELQQFWDELSFNRKNGVRIEKKKSNRTLKTPKKTIENTSENVDAIEIDFEGENPQQIIQQFLEKEKQLECYVSNDITYDHMIDYLTKSQCIMDDDEDNIPTHKVKKKINIPIQKQKCLIMEDDPDETVEKVNIDEFLNNNNKREYSQIHLVYEEEDSFNHRIIQTYSEPIIIQSNIRAKLRKKK